MVSPFAISVDTAQLTQFCQKRGSVNESCHTNQNYFLTLSIKTRAASPLIVSRICVLSVMATALIRSLIKSTKIKHYMT